MENNNVNFATFLKQYPDKNGYFGRYGGAYLPDELVPAFNEINDAYQTICKSSKLFRNFVESARNFRADLHRFITATGCRKASASARYT